jgi:hypothetical protein
MQCLPELFCPERCFLFNAKVILTTLPRQHDQQLDELENSLQCSDGASLARACRKIVCLATSVPGEALGKLFLQTVFQRYIHEILNREDHPELLAVDDEVFRTWLLLHVLHHTPQNFELDSLNTLLGTAPQAHLPYIPSYANLAQEPFLVLRLPVPVLLVPGLLHIAMIVLRSALAASSAEYASAVKAIENKRSALRLSDVQQHRCKLFIHANVSSELLGVFRDCITVHGLLRLLEIVECSCESVDDWPRRVQAHGIISVMLKLLLSEQLLQVLWIQGLTRRQTMVLHNMNVPSVTLAPRTLRCLTHMEKCERLEEVFYQVEALLLFSDDEKVVDSLCAVVPSSIVSAITDFLLYYCRPAELLEAIANTLRALAAKAPLQVLYLRSKLTREMIKCHPKQFQDKVNNMLDTLCKFVHDRLKYLRSVPCLNAANGGSLQENDRLNDDTGRATSSKRARIDA